MVGCAIDLNNDTDAYKQRLRECFDFAYLPVPWRVVEPAQQQREWELIDNWIDWLARAHMPMKMGPLVSLDPKHVPDWLSEYEGDFEAVRNLLFEHVRRVVERYGNYIYHWDVISGVHAENVFAFTFEQLMELTRITVSLVKQLAPRAQAAIDIVTPWGEYYARNQRTIPPMFYADMVAQSGVGFDGIAVQFLFGPPVDGMFVRDMFQISEKLDRLGNLGKPVHITAVQIPSKPVKSSSPFSGGCWLKPWDETVQAKWIKEFYTVALSKPFVESVTWKDLADRDEDHPIPAGGLLRANMAPKLGYKVLKEFRNEFQSLSRRPPAPKANG
jgi:GH35 family endo-1,4-beta-xylanase